MDVGGAVWIFPPGGCGGIKGMFCGGTLVSEAGWAGVGFVGDAGWDTGPGAGGVGPTAVVLFDPGRTMVSESCMLGLVLGSVPLSTAKVLCHIVSESHQKREVEPYLG